MRLTGHVTLNFNNIPIAAVVLVIEYHMVSWLAIQVMVIGLSDQFNQAYYLFSFAKKIQCFGKKRNVYAKGNASRFRIAPYTV
jgi:hypothetical protein